MNEKKPGKVFRILMLSLCVLGILLRFHNLDYKVFSNDETFSLLTIFGHQLGDIQASGIVTVSTLQSFQRIDTQETILSSLHRHVAEPYVFPPLYSALMSLWARFWSQYLTQPAVITRSLSVALGVLCLPSAYWLSDELFNSRRAAWLTAGLFAISPFHLQYAQIVRTYSLTTLSVLMSTTLLLRATRLKTRASWIFYGVSVSIALYSNLLCGFLIISHVLYVVWLEKFRITTAAKGCVVAATAGGLAFVPWFYLFVTKPGLLGYSVAQVQAADLSSIARVTRWIRVACLIFSDFNNPWMDSTAALRPLQQLSFAMVVPIIAVSFYFLLKRASRTARILLLSLVLCTGASLMLKDVLWGGTYSSRPRYMIPYVIAIELTVIAWISYEMVSTIRWRKWTALVSLVVILGSGLLSSLVISKSQSWSAFGAPDYPMIAAVINQSTNPVVLFEDFGDALALSYLLESNIHIHLNRDSAVSLLQEKGQPYQCFDNIYFFKPEEETLAKLQQSDDLAIEAVFSQDDRPQKIGLWLVNA